MQRETFKAILAITGSRASAIHVVREIFETVDETVFAQPVSEDDFWTGAMKDSDTAN